MTPDTEAGTGDGTGIGKGSYVGAGEGFVRDPLTGIGSGDGSGGVIDRETSGLSGRGYGNGNGNGNGTGLGIACGAKGSEVWWYHDDD